LVNKKNQAAGQRGCIVGLAAKFVNWGRRDGPPHANGSKCESLLNPGGRSGAISVILMAASDKAWIAIQA
jgi:hypothetical protein